MKRLIYAVLALLLPVALNAKSPKQVKKVLVVISGVNYVTGTDGKRHTTGYWVEEFTRPYVEFQKAGIEMVVATPGGVAPSIDPQSFNPNFWPSKEELAEAQKIVETAPELKNIYRLESFKEKDLKGFSAVFYPGGHAPMEDLAKNKDSGRILRHFHEKNKPTALVCHGPIALAAAKNKEGE